MAWWEPDDKFPWHSVVGFVVGIVPDLLICWAVAAYTGSAWYGFFLTLAALYALYFFLSFKNALWSWLLFWLYDKQNMARKFEKFLAKSDFPAPERYVTTIDDYLVQLMNSELLDCPLRVKAAFELGTLNGFKATGNASLVLKMRMATKVAMQRYGRYAPKSLHTADWSE
jgi:hypothetical protein